MSFMPSSKQLSILFLLIIAVGFTGWLALHHTQSNHIANIINNNPDSIAENVTIINMDLEGNPSSHFSSAKMIHYPNKNTTLVTQPNLVVFIKNEQPWHITAKQGKAVDGNALIQLWDNVKFVQPASQANPESTVLTEKFIFWPQKKIAETDKPITLLQPGTKVTAVGLIANTATGQIDLLKDVRGSYVAQ